MEEMRKRRIELEVAVKGLEGRVKELEKSEREGVKALEKERKRAEKLDTRAQSFEVSILIIDLAHHSKKKSLTVGSG